MPPASPLLSRPTPSPPSGNGADGDGHAAIAARTPVGTTDRAAPATRKEAARHAGLTEAEGRLLDDLFAII